MIAAFLVFAVSAPLDAIGGGGDATAVAVVSRYVQQQKHWKQADYQIRCDRTEDQCIVFRVTYLPEQKRAMIAGGETFEAYYDPKQRKVVKEMYFQ